MNPLIKMQVVGETTQQKIFIASEDRKFRINEILIIQDENLGNVIGEVIETSSFNHYIPMTNERNKMMDSSVLEGLKQVGYNVDEAEVNIAKVRMLSELPYPIKTGTQVRLPEFHEIEKMLVQDVKGWNVGILRGTEEVAHQLPPVLQNKGMLRYDNGSVVPYHSVPFLFNYKKMSEYPHFGIFGGSGSGKSYGSRVIEEEIMKNRIPAIVADPHYEKDFSQHPSDMPSEHLTSFDNRYAIFTIGKDIGIPFEELSAGEFVKILSASSKDVSENMESAIFHLFDKNSTLDTFLFKVNTLCYIYDNRNKFDKEVDSINELEEDRKDVVTRQLEVLNKYESKCNSSAAKGIQWRLNALVRYNMFKGNIRPVVDSMKGRKLVVIRGSIEHLKLFLSFLINKIYSLRREYMDSISQNTHDKDFFPPFITILDEAHNFAPKGGDAPTKSVLKEIAQEGRKYGAFLGFATQRPALLDDTIMAQLSTKFLFRTVRGQDIKSLSEETDLSAEDANRLPYLPSGDCFVSSAVIGRTVSVRIRYAGTKSPIAKNPFDELEESVAGDNNPLAEEILAYGEELKPQDITIVMRRLESRGIKTSRHEIQEVLDELVFQKRLLENVTPFGKIYKQV